MFETIKDFFKNFFQSRMVVLGGLLICLSGILLWRVFDLQIIRGAQYQENYSLSIQKPRTLNSTRGKIFDRNGEVLAYNELAYSINIEDNGSYSSTKEKNAAINQELYEILQVLDQNGDTVNNTFDIVLNDDGSYSFQSTGSTRLRFLADVYGRSKVTDEKFVNENKKLGYTEAEATADQVIEYLCEKKDNIGYGLSTKDFSQKDLYRIMAIRFAMSKNGYQKYITTPIALDVSEKTVAYINENMADLQGVSVAEDTSRKYVDSKYFSHIIGHTGKISQEEYDELSQTNDSYSLTDVVGKSGIEQVMDETLQGKKGSETVFVDSMGKVLETKDRIEPSVGNDVYLSIDKNLQEAAYDLLEQEIAGIVYSKIENIKEYNSSGSAADIKIPIYDVYYALINNNVIDISHFSEDDASQMEQTVQASFLSKLDQVIDALYGQLQAASPAAYADLPDEQQVYMSYVVTLLTENEILLTDKIDTSDEVYLDWKNDKISLAQYLNHAIAQNWIDITGFAVNEKYADSTEIYDALIQYVLEELKTDRRFAKKVYKYLIQEDTVTGTQLCLMLFDQGVLKQDDAQIAELTSGSKSAYTFLREKIQNLEITPAQLALDPCSGSCVITDVKNGELLACVTYPGYDNNKLANSVDANYFRLLNEDLSLPQYNYATQQRTAPGSTFKMVTAAGGLTEGFIASTEEKIEDKGQFEEVVDGPKCWIFPHNHGFVNVSEAIRDSCNYFFYEVGYRMSRASGVYNEAQGIKILNKYASLFGLNETTGIEIPENDPQIADSYPITAAIGQSNNNFTTTQLARYVTAVANSGTVYQYTLLEKVTDSEGNVIKDYKPQVRNTIDTVSSTAWDAIHSGMRMVVETSKQFDDFTVSVAGKTGTAQQIPTRPNHALFVGYAPYEDPQISIATRIAYGYTSTNTVSFAANVLKYYFKLEDTSTLIDGKAEDVGATTNSFND